MGSLHTGLLDKGLQYTKRTASGNNIQRTPGPESEAQAGPHGEKQPSSSPEVAIIFTMPSTGTSASTAATATTTITTTTTTTTSTTVPVATTSAAATSSTISTITLSLNRALSVTVLRHYSFYCFHYETGL